MNPFQLSRNTTLLSDAVTEKAVELACERLRRDMEKTLTDIVKNRNRIILCKKDLKPEPVSYTHLTLPTNSRV